MTKAVLIGLAVLGTACGNPDGTCGPSTGVVTRIIDGDTVELETGEKLRYLMVDTPEITNGKNDCYGQEASDFNASLVLGKEVTIAYDPLECTDRFDRTLAYVSVEGREVNALLVERGFACVLYIPPSGADRRDEFNALELTAKTEGRGLWGACEDVTCD